MTSYTNYSWPGRVWQVTSRLGTGIPKSFFNGVGTCTGQIYIQERVIFQQTRLLALVLFLTIQDFIKHQNRGVKMISSIIKLIFSPPPARELISTQSSCPIQYICTTVCHIQFGKVRIDKHAFYSNLAKYTCQRPFLGRCRQNTWTSFSSTFLGIKNVFMLNIFKMSSYLHMFLVNKGMSSAKKFRKTKNRKFANLQTLIDFRNFREWGNLRICDLRAQSFQQFADLIFLLT